MCILLQSHEQAISVLHVQCHVFTYSASLRQAAELHGNKVSLACCKGLFLYLLNKYISRSHVAINTSLAEALLTLYLCHSHLYWYSNFPVQLSYHRGLCVPQLTGLMFCSHVNKKALDQYTNFTEQREELARRQTENGRGEDKIKQLIQTLDMRKDEAIERTFKVHTLHANSP